MKWLFAVILTAITVLLASAYLHWRAMQDARIYNASLNLQNAYRCFLEHGTLTNRVPSLDRVFVFTNSVVIGGSNYHCAVGLSSATFAHVGILAVTTNQEIVWLDEKKGPRVIDLTQSGPLLSTYFD